MFHMKKMLVILVSALLALMMTCAFAEEAAEPTVYTSGDWEYVLLEDGTAEIMGYDGRDKELTIPAEIDGYAVTAIGGSEGFRHSLQKLTIPDAVIRIAANPFTNCRRLEQIQVSPEHPTLAVIDGVLFEKTTKTLVWFPCKSQAESYAVPQGISNIGNGAFYECSNLTSITIPDSVTNIGDYAFYRCTSLASITMPDSVTTIGNRVFSGCTSLTSITISDSVTSIGDYAFSGCESLARITLPDSVVSIGSNCFYSCGSLVRITLPANLTHIGEDVFDYCDSLQYISIPDSIHFQGANPFDACSALAQIHVSPEHPTLATINGALFDKTKKTLICCPAALEADSYSIPQGIIAIGDLAFAGCASLSSILIPDSVTTIGEGAFAGCLSLTDIVVPDSVTVIGAGAFNSCISLTSISLPNTITAIGDWTFYGCRSLQSLEIPDGVTTIGWQNFLECDSLTQVTIPESVTLIEDDAYTYFLLGPAITFTVIRDSYAHQWCKDGNVPYTFPDSLDWLLN